jgi:hypothetical protein
MKNPGTPEIDEDSDNGSGGVSADGFGARLPRFGFAVAPPVDPFALPPVFFAEPVVVGWPVCFGAPAAGVPPCELWPLICGAGVTSVLVVPGVGAGAGSLVVGAAGVGGVSAVGVELVVSAGGLVSVVVGTASSTASELAGRSSSVAAAQASSSVSSRVISLSCPRGS